MRLRPLLTRFEYFRQIKEVSWTRGTLKCQSYRLLYTQCIE
uniref:Uncharacterized protein n=1 Tax=Anguilla anguilla TaxID=7936 RepID=A0A0E9TXS6_ANGAN